MCNGGEPFVLDWSKVRHFEPDEITGYDMGLVSLSFIWELDCFRHWVNKKFITGDCWANVGHAANSFHGKAPCVAIDGSFPNLSLYEQFLLALSWNGWSAVGCYTWWNSPGLHLDKRPIDIMSEGKHAWISPVKGVYKYLKARQFTPQTIMKLLAAY